jgi:putative membrane protein
MRGFLVRLIITALGLWVADLLLPGIAIEGTGALIVSALLLGIVNAVIRPILIVLTLPLTVVTLGLFILVVNGISLALVAWLVSGFHIAGLFSATLGAIIVSLVSWAASSFVGGSGRIEQLEHSGRTRCVRASVPTCSPFSKPVAATRCITRSPCSRWRSPQCGGLTHQRALPAGCSSPARCSFREVSTRSHSPARAGSAPSLRSADCASWPAGHP